MTLWTATLLASGLCFAIKFAGYLLPHEWLEHPRVSRTAALITVALLAALVSVQTLGDGQRITLDARIPALAVAAVLLWRRAPFVVVVLVAGAVAAGIRLAG
jgi:hypothetical protein